MSLPLAQAKIGNKQFWKQKFHAANEEAQHALTGGPVFFFWGRLWRGFFCPPFPNLFAKLFPKMFPIVPYYYGIWFAQSSTLMYINWKGETQRSTFVSILQLGVFQSGVSVGGKLNVANEWPISIAPFKIKKKCCSPSMI